MLSVVNFMSKFKKITGHLYVAENQNGFNNAMYDYFNATNEGIENTKSKKQVRDMIQNFPTIYPIAFVIVDQSFECSRVYIEEFDLDLEGNSYYKNSLYALNRIFGITRVISRFSSQILNKNG